MAVSSVSITSVNLYAEAARSGRGERREREASQDCVPCQPRAERRSSMLADAMREAFEALGWSRSAAPQTSEPASEVPSGGEAVPLDEAVAGFAAALAQALKDVRRGEMSPGEGHGGRRGHHGRPHGMAPRIDMLVVQMQASTPPAEEAPANSPTAPRAAPAPAPEPMTIDPTTDVPASAVATPPAPTDAPEAAGTSGADEPLAVAPPPAPQQPGGLVEAFEQLLDSLRNSGVNIPADESAANSLVRFLNQLAESLRGRAAPSRFDSMPVFSGTFVRIVV